MTTLSACVIPASAEDAAKTGAFKETFDNYGSGNWLANMAEDGVLVDSTKIEGMEENAWTIYAGKSSTKYAVADIAEKASIEVVAEPGNESNRVLKLDAGALEDNEFFYFKRNSNGGNKIAHKDIQGKKMVIKAKYKIPTGFNMTGDTAMLGYDARNGHPGRFYYNQSGANYSDTTWTILASDSLTWQSNLNVSNRDTVPVDQWFEVRQVITLSGDNTAEHPADTYRGLLNGDIYTMNMPKFADYMTGTKLKEMNSKFPQPSNELGKSGEKIVDSTGGYVPTPSNTSFSNFGDFYGVAMSITGATGSTTDYMYMDDLEVYYIDDFKQEGEAIIEKNVDGNWYAGEIKIPFTNELKDEITEVHYDDAKDRSDYANYQYLHTTYTPNPVKLGTLTYKAWNHVSTDAFYKDLFTLKDAEGNVVEGGIADAYAEGKYLVIEPAKTLDRNVAYTVSASPVFIDVEGQGLNQYSEYEDIYTFNTAEDPYAHIIYSFDFEDNKVDGVNWIESRNNTTDRYVVADGVELGAITINKHSSLPANHGQSITVAADPTGADNKVLALKAGYADGTTIKTGWVTQLRFNANGKAGISRDKEMGKGKNLVYKAKIFIPSGFSMTESSQLVNTGSETQASANTTSGIGATLLSGFYTACVGGWGAPIARVNVGQNAMGGQWVEWKHVADVSEALSETHSDTVRAYVNDIMATPTFITTSNPTAPFNTPFEKYSNIAVGDTIIDHLSGSKTLFENGKPASIGATWWGSAFNINPQADTTKSDVFYIDDVEAFWIDDLTFTAVNAANFEGGKVKLNFNQKIREEVRYSKGNKDALSTLTSANDVGTKTLADLFKIVDTNGKVIENGVAAVTLSEDGKTVSITPDASLEKGGDYQIEISPYLVDEYGQGLLNNSKATYVDLHISETFTPFEMTSISQKEVSGFAQGREVKITAKFSVAVDDESITNGIVVTNKDTGATVARNAGWTAAFGTDEEGGVDYKTITFDFGSLPTANYLVTINDKFLATNGAELASNFNIAINKANDRIVLFEEDFENYAQENWLADKYEVTDGTLYSGNPDTWSKAYYKSYTINNHDWDIQLHYTTAAANEAPATIATNDFAGIVSAPEKASKMSGNVLKLDSTRSGSYSDNYVAFRRNFNGLNGINFASEEYKGKKLVYEADIFADKNASDNSFFVPFAGTNTKAVRDYADWMMLFQGGAIRSPGAWQTGFTSYGALPMYSQKVPSTDIKKDSVHYKMVISMGDDVDTVAYYSNGQLVQRNAEVQAILKGHEWNDSARHEFFRSAATDGKSFNANDILYGIWGLAGQGKTTVYVDNFKAYLVDEFNVESVEGAGQVFNTAKGTVTYTFSKPVDPDAAIANDTIVLLDEKGEVVADGITSVKLSDANYKVTVKLSETLPGLTTYSIKLTEALKDVDGLPLSTKWKKYTYPIADYYPAVAENVYSVTSVDGSGPIDLYYIPATGSDPAYIATTATGSNKAAVDTYVRNADAMKMFTVLKTSKATSLFADASEAIVNGKEVSTTVKFTNPEVAPMSVWCVVAAYGEYDEMLGCTTVNVTEVEASSSTDDIPVNFTVSSSAIKSVKMFVWDTYDDMRPYQKSEEILNK